jgi:hypothetical protein
MKTKKMFNECAKKFGTVVWEGVELALTQDPYPFGTDDDWYFTATAMDKQGNLWDVSWYPRPDANKYDDYADQVEDWDKPYFAGMICEGYYRG